MSSAMMPCTLGKYLPCMLKARGDPAESEGYQILKGWFSRNYEGWLIDQNYFPTEISTLKCLRPFIKKTSRNYE